MPDTPIVRTLRVSDIPSAMRLKDAAGWNQTEQDWRNLLRLAPEGCFGLESDGVLAATTTAVTYGTGLAWIGMVLTDPAYRGRGFARRLMEHALAFLKRQQVQFIKLDATDLGYPLYRKLGFADEQPIERWLRQAHCPPCPIPASPTSPLSEECRILDTQAFGADRWELITLLAALESAVVPDGHAMGRPGCKATYFGPCVSRSCQAARDLLSWFLSGHSSENIYWDLLPANQEAVRLARQFGFERHRQLIRMARCETPGSPPLAPQERYIYAAAGFEFG